MKQLIKSFICALIATPVLADGETAGDFDYYVLSLSWTPTWCALEGDDRGSAQCDDDTGFGWSLHGLWPQNEQGWPSFCTTVARDPSRGQTGGMADIMGSGGLAWYEWKKHGRCSGLAADDYFSAARQAYESINRPPILRQLTDAISVPASVIEAAFLEVNPQLSPDQITITCKSHLIQEARICLTRDLQPRDCSPEVVQDCTLDDALMQPMR